MNEWMNERTNERIHLAKFPKKSDFGCFQSTEVRILFYF
jgi:hypothetical protein